MIKKIFLMLLAPLCVLCGSAYAHQRIAAVAVINDECQDLVHWIERNERIGIEMFFLYPCGDVKSYLPILDPYIESGIVHLLDNPFIGVDNEINHPMHRYMAFDQALSACFFYSVMSEEEEEYFDWLILLEQNDLPKVPNRSVNVSLDLIPQQVSVIRLDWFRTAEDSFEALFFDDRDLLPIDEDLEELFPTDSWKTQHQYDVKPTIDNTSFPKRKPKEPKPKRPYPFNGKKSQYKDDFQQFKDDIERAGR